jgi:large conductance mechanosensitive channel
MGMVKEFKEFISRGSLIEMAVGVVMGIAFGNVVTAFIDGMVMPAVGMLTGGVDFNDLVFVLKESVAEVKEGGNVIVAAVPEVAIKYGTFITVAIEFLIISFVVFMVIKAINKMKKKQAEAPQEPVAPSIHEVLLAEIRDLLKK